MSDAFVIAMSGKFLRFLLEITQLLTLNMYKGLPLERRIFKIMTFFPKLLSCPVYVHLTQFSYIHKTRFFHENSRSKLMCQPLCCMLIVFSLRFMDRNRLCDQPIYCSAYYSCQEKACKRFDVLLRHRLRFQNSKRFTSVSAYACFC